MFNLDGSRSTASKIAQTIIDTSGLELDPSKSDAMAIVLYRRDPLDGYLYLTAMGGLREPEPLFGPFNWDEYYKRRDRREHAASDQGFRAREGTNSVDIIDQHSWRFYINGRDKSALEKYMAVKQKLLSSIASVMENYDPGNKPLFPDLWYHERLGRDNLRSNAQVLAPGTSLEEFARHLTVALRDTAIGWLGSAKIRVGIYLDTGQSWNLCGLRPIRPWLPERIDEGQSGEQNAFNWVRSSLSPVLLRPKMSQPWEERLRRCGVNISNAISHPSFSGMCIVPIPHNQQPWRCMGIILLVAIGPAVHPAHAYLLNRLALAVSGYLMPLFPIPGFLWMPEAKLGRGNAIVSSPSTSFSVTSEVPPEVVRQAAEDLLPNNSRIRISTLRAGHSGAVVYKLGVWDEGGIAEVPRVLKVGREDVIAAELRKYYRYAHNKKVGGASRIDIAREFHLSDDHPPSPQQMYGAIVYTLVGAGDQAIPWSEWATEATIEELESGCEMLLDQLSCWYDRTRRSDSKAIDLMLRPLAEGKLLNHLNLSINTQPTFEDVKQKLILLCAEKPISKDCRTCVVHGDLHGDNIFAILTHDKKIRGVALIDWGTVRSERHQLSDISKLMTDLVYRVGLTSDAEKWAFEKVREWGQRFGCDPNDWRVALIHQIAKIMFYKYGSDDKIPYITENSRARAWVHLNKLAGELLQ